MRGAGRPEGAWEARTRGRGSDVADPNRPQFTLPKSGGGEVSLADLTSSNKYSVVYFYNQDGSPGCSLEAARFQQGLPEFEKRKAQVVGISMDSLEKHDEACSKGSLTFPLLSDNTGEVSKSYGADLSIPILGKFSDRQTFLVDESGTVVGHWLEKDFSMKSVKAPLGPGSHVQQILDAIDALG